MSSLLDGVYSRRSSDRDHAEKERIWPPIVAYLRRYMAQGPVLDVGCDRAISAGTPMPMSDGQPTFATLERTSRHRFGLFR